MEDRAEKYRTDPGNLEERSAVRFPLNLPVHVIASDKLYQATTENISANGVLFRIDKTDEAFAPGTEIDFLIQVDTGTTGAEETAAIHCIGRIVRAYDDGATTHAAAIIDEYRFQSEQEDKKQE